MHPCLKLHEMLLCIFHWVYSNSDPDSKPFSSLLALALTCRTFLEPALDVLWQTHATLGPLLQTLPEDAWEVVHDSQSPYAFYTVRLTRALLPQDWSRFNVYAPRIKHLHWRISFLKSVAEDPSIHSQLASENPAGGGFLLPNLTFLNYPRSRQQLLQYLGPSLSHIEIIAAADISPIIDRLDFIRQSYPWWSLEGFAVFPRRPEPLDITPILQLDIWSSIESLQFAHCRLSQQDIMFLAKLPALRYILLAPPLDAMFFHLKNVPLSSKFISLQHLDITVNSLGSCTFLLSQLTACRLISLQTTCKGPIVTYEELAEFTFALSENCTHSSLRILLVAEDVSDSIVLGHSRAIDEAALAPLLAFHNMESMNINISRSWDVGNALIASMASAWPLICALRMGSEFGWGCPSKVTFSGLAALAHACPHLRQLWLTVDLTKDHLVASDTPVEMVQAGPGALIQLCVSDSPTTDLASVAVARNLFALFPHLCRVSGLFTWTPFWLADPTPANIGAWWNATMRYWEEVTDGIGGLASAAAVDRSRVPKHICGDYRLAAPRSKYDH